MRIKIRDTRICFPSVFRPTSFSDDQEKKFSALLTLPKGNPQVAMVEKAMESVAADKWASKATQVMTELKAKNRLFLHDGSEKAGTPGFGPEVVYLSASNKNRPTIVGPTGAPLVEEDGMIYPGCHVHAILDLWAMDGQWGRRICATLGGLVFYKHDEPFSGSRAVDIEEMADLLDQGDDDFLD